MPVRDGRASEQKASWAKPRPTSSIAARHCPFSSTATSTSATYWSAHAAGLCAIDPLPCAGDPAYDAGYWVHGNRRPGRRARLDAIVSATGLERAPRARLGGGHRRPRVTIRLALRRRTGTEDAVKLLEGEELIWQGHPTWRSIHLLLHQVDRARAAAAGGDRRRERLRHGLAASGSGSSSSPAASCSSSSPAGSAASSRATGSRRSTC